MRIVLITTTIGVPEVLRHFRRLGPDVHFIVAGDLKTPHGAVRELLDGLGNATYLHPDWQRACACSEVIGWNTVHRRNIALLKALERRPDIIVTIDDDNYPTGDYFADMRQSFAPQYCLSVDSDALVFNYGTMFEPEFLQRGCRYEDYAPCRVGLGRMANVGVCQGVVLGEPDRAACERLGACWEPILHLPHLLEHGVIVRDYTPVNTQNTGMLASLAPWYPCVAGTGRGNDILGGFILQRAAQEQGYDVFLGPPVVWQERHKHDLRFDYDREKDLDYANEFIEYLEGNGPSFDYLARCPLLPTQAREFLLAWKEDIECVSQ